ncbi:hypothetical protein [Hymenobacter sp. UYCo722]|uniref:hypothetical protein n=1 Tax=Hymenobacter sp. UYCo722 TaxID=3156335 RepID=UPI00339ABF91
MAGELEAEGGGSAAGIGAGLTRFDYIMHTDTSENQESKFHNLSIDYDANPETYAAISTLLGKMPAQFSNPADGIWTYQVVTGSNDEYFDFINVFLDILEGKYDELAQLGVLRNDIQFWLNYEYHGQCNLEYPPQQMQRLGKNGVTLCISCFQIRSS